MTKWHHRSPRDIELRRLKNKLRQQRYRARKREEKSGVGNTLLSDLFISTLPNVTNELCLLKHDLGSLNTSTDPEDGTRLIECGHGNGVCSPIGTELLQNESILKQEGQQQQETHQCNVEFLETDVVGDPFIFPKGCHRITSNKIQQLLPEPEDVYVNTIQMECDSSAMSLDEKDQCRIMARRLKNRERQRRYRARRRLEADMKKAHIINELTPQALDLQTNGIKIDHVNQVHCRRKWKEDARRARATKQPELTLTEPQDPPELTLAEPQCPVLDLASEHQGHVNAKKEPELTSSDPVYFSELKMVETQYPVTDHVNEEQTHISTENGAISVDATAEPELTPTLPQYPPELASSERQSTVLDHASEHQTCISSAEDVGRAYANKELEMTLTKPQYPAELTPTQPQSPVLENASEHQMHISPAEDAKSAHPTSEPELALAEPQYCILHHASENQTHVPRAEITVESQAEPDVQSEHLVTFNGDETNENSHGRRDWKEDARNKAD